MIMEDVTYNNTGTNGQTEFHYVMKKMVPNQTGTIIGDLLYGDTLHYSLSYTFNGNYDPTTSYGDPQWIIAQNTPLKISLVYR